MAKIPYQLVLQIQPCTISFYVCGMRICPVTSKGIKASVLLFVWHT